MPLVALSELLGATVRDATGTVRGRVREIAVAPQDHPTRIAFLIVRTADGERILPVESLKNAGVTVRAHTEAADWEQYKKVNAKFADAVVKEAHSEDPVVLVQDYHFALLPRMIRQRLQKATIITFWHIPWPNPEAFAICPWRVELLDGLLGSDILGFHTQFHVNNFLESVDRFLESRIDRETFTVVYGGNRTSVHRYPISIEWPPAPLARAVPIDSARERVRVRFSLPRGHKVGVGVERLDYTKGIIERFNAVERLLQLHPEWLGRFTFIQIAAPSRATIADYREYGERVRAAYFHTSHPGLCQALRRDPRWTYLWFEREFDPIAD